MIDVNNCKVKAKCDDCDSRCPRYIHAKDYRDIIEFLLDELEEEHCGLKGKMITELKNRWGIDY